MVGATATAGTPAALTMPLRPLRFTRCWLAGWIAALLATVAVCLLPMPAIAPSVDHVDKIEHALGFALLGAYAAMLFDGRHALLRAGAGLIAFGAAIELLQIGVPWRSGDPYDLIADAAGVAIGCSITAATPAARLLHRIEQAVPLRRKR